MMKHAFLFQLLIIGLLTQSWSQEKKPEVLFGKKEPASKFATLHEIVGYDATGVYALKYMGKPWSISDPTIHQYELVHYDDSMNLVNSLALKLKTEKKFRKLEFIFYSNGALHVFSSFKNKKQKKKYLFVETVDKHSMTFNNDLRKISEIDYSEHSRANTGEFSYNISRDSSKVMIYMEALYQGQEKERFEVCVLDESLNKLWEKPITLPYSDRLFNIQKFEVDDHGNAYILGKRYKDSFREEANGMPNFQYHLLGYLNEGKQVQDYPLELQGILPVNIEFDFTSDQKIVCAGFYANLGASKESSIHIKGTYYVVIDPETKQVLTRAAAQLGFDHKVRKVKRVRTVSMNTSHLKGGDISELDLGDLIIRRDGGTVLIGEESYSKSYSSQNSSHTYYYHKDIVVISLSPNGNIEWTLKISKNQKTLDEDVALSSYLPVVVGDKIHILYNDSHLNMELESGEEIHQYTAGGGQLTILATIDKTGKLTKRELINSKEAKAYIELRVSNQQTDKEVILFGKRFKMHCMAKVTFP
ncbi:MAG: hypothetical protein AAGI38_09400 [Bacteroidota bacterium]